MCEFWHRSLRYPKIIIDQLGTTCWALLSLSISWCSLAHMVVGCSCLVSLDGSVMTSSTKPLGCINDPFSYEQFTGIAV